MYSVRNVRSWKRFQITISLVASATDRIFTDSNNIELTNGGQMYRTVVVKLPIEGYEHITVSSSERYPSRETGINRLINWT